MLEQLRANLSELAHSGESLEQRVRRVCGPAPDIQPVRKALSPEQIFAAEYHWWETLISLWKQGPFQE